MKSLQTYLNSKGASLVVDGIAGKKTFEAMQIILELRCRDLGYKWFPSNIIALRMDGDFTDKFTDYAAVIRGGKVVSVIPWTTKAGKFYVSNPLTVGGITGTGTMKEGQHLNSHKFTTAANKYKSPYFAQVATIPVYRDGNKDNKLDKNVVQFAPSWYAFLLHQMGEGFSIWNWSAGCNGCPRAQWINQVVPYFQNGDVISYTIIET